jgi:pilus assembly protein Flp/PilA
MTAAFTVLADLAILRGHVVFHARAPGKGYYGDSAGIEIDQPEQMVLELSSQGSRNEGFRAFSTSGEQAQLIVFSVRWQPFFGKIIMLVCTCSLVDGLQAMKAVLRERIWKDTRGQDLIEYALVAGFVAVFAGVVMPGVANSINIVFSTVNSMLIRAASS